MAKTKRTNDPFELREHQPDGIVVDNLYGRGICSVPKSMLGKHPVELFTNENPLTDSRERVWKVWSKVCEEMYGSKHDHFFEHILMPAMRRSRHFSIPRDVDRFHGFDDPKRKNIYEEWRGGDTSSHMDLIRSMWDNFILPFEVCALSLPGEAVAIMFKMRDLTEVQGGASEEPITFDTLIERGNDSVGLHGFWWITILAPVVSKSGDDHYSSHSMMLSGSIHIEGDSIDEMDEKNGMFRAKYFPLWRTDCMDDGRVVGLWRWDKDYETDSQIDPISDLAQTSQLAIDLLVMIQSHKRFIVQVDPPDYIKRKVAKRKKKVLVEPMSNKPVFISLEPKEIRERLNIPKPEGEAGKRAPHERRAHLRKLTSPRFRWK